MQGAPSATEFDSRRRVVRPNMYLIALVWSALKWREAWVRWLLNAPLETPYLRAATFVAPVAFVVVSVLSFP